MSDTRLLTPRDMPALMRLSEAAGWNQLEADWQRLLELEPQGCFGIECDGALAATATTFCYGARLAWIGMVLTGHDYRRRGLGRRVTERAIEYADERQVEWIKLDATAMGRPLYLQLGFEDECPIERWGATTPGSAPGVHGLEPFRHDPALDFRAFGADRSVLLDKLARGAAASVSGEGYGMARSGAKAAAFGPCVARTADVAETLLRWFLNAHPGQAVFWDLLPDNRTAVELGMRYGFKPLRQLVRMVRPGRTRAAPFRADSSIVYAAAGFEYG
jgi:GNAT superfamily N-acetyltransferase